MRIAREQLLRVPSNLDWFVTKLIIERRNDESESNGSFLLDEMHKSLGKDRQKNRCYMCALTRIHFSSNESV